jgi:hypothetical protein
MEAVMKIGQVVESTRRLRGTRGAGDIVVGKGVRGTVMGFIGNKVKVEFDGPYVSRTPGRTEEIEGKVRVLFGIVRSKDYINWPSA